MLKIVSLQLYKTFVGLLLQYYVYFWSPQCRKDEEALVWVQKRFARFLPGLEGTSYEERLDILGLFCLGSQKLRRESMQVFKIMSSNVTKF